MLQTENTVRLNKVTRELNLGLHTIVDFLAGRGIAVDANPNAKISKDVYALLTKEFGNEQSVKDKEAAKKVVVAVQKKAKEAEEPAEQKPLIVKDTSVLTPDKPALPEPKVTGEKMDVEAASKGKKATGKAADEAKEQAPKKKVESPKQPKAKPSEAKQPEAKPQQREAEEHPEKIQPQEEPQEGAKQAVAPQEEKREAKQAVAPQEEKREAKQAAKAQVARLQVVEVELQEDKEEEAP
ncbi:MAG: hypothetical protein LBF55_02320, partial [Prevotellaceae bacterium]|nr:hypothetical protein [Prevotellaceae bacterium]